MDETSDISRTEEVSLCLRCIINGETKETFVGFFATASTEGECDYRRTSGHVIPSRELHVDYVLSFSL